MQIFPPWVTWPAFVLSMVCLVFALYELVWHPKEQ